VLTTMCLAKMGAFDANHDDTVLTMGLHRVTDPSGCGIATLDESGRVTGFEEKSSNPKGLLAFAGNLLARPTLVDYLPDGVVPLDFGHHVFPRLSGRMRGYVVSEYVIDIGTKERLAEAEARWPGLYHGIHSSKEG